MEAGNRLLIQRFLIALLRARRSHWFATQDKDLFSDML
jgi:hypothetical protein